MTPFGKHGATTAAHAVAEMKTAKIVDSILMESPPVYQKDDSHSVDGFIVFSFQTWKAASPGGPPGGSQLVATVRNAAILAALTGKAAILAAMAEYPQPPAAITVRNGRIKELKN